MQFVDVKKLCLAVGGMIILLANSSASVFAAMSDCKNPVKILLRGYVTMRFCEIPAGRAAIGSEHGDSNEKPVKVRNFKAFQIGQFEVTQKQYRVVMGEEPWRGQHGNAMKVKNRANIPAVHVGFRDANEFARRISQLDPTANYRLPTEAEWEYAARGGTTTEYYWGNSFDERYAYFEGNEPNLGLAKVKSCPDGSGHSGYCANGFGLMHMLGNVWEWTQDTFVANYNQASEDGHVAMQNGGSVHVIRGGSTANNSHAYLRAASRSASDSDANRVGFRLVRLPRIHMNSLDSSFGRLSERVYAYKSRFFSVAADIAGSLNVAGDWNYEGMQAFTGRLFLLNAMAPVVFGTDSEYFLKEVHDLYREELQRVNEKNRIASLSDIAPNPVVLKAALKLLVSALHESRNFVTDVSDRRAVERVLTACGTVLAGPLENRRAVEPVLNELGKYSGLLEAIAANRHARELGQVAESIVEYLKGI